MLPPRLTKVDLHLLYVFAVVAEARSFAAAQAVLNTSPSTISRQISDLESRLGAVLCQRGRSGFRLTGFGQRVVDATSELFSSLEQFNNAVTGRKLNLSGKLSIGVIDNWVSNAQAPIVGTLSKFHERAKNISVWASLDGEKFEKVWSAKQPKSEWMIDLPANVRAKFIRIGLEGSGTFHLNRAAVYGR